MIPEFKELSQKESQLLLQTPALVTVLIAAADSQIDESETNWAEKVVGYRQKIGEKDLFEYYEAVDENFKATINALTSDNKGTQERIANITTTLETLNTILPKLDTEFAAKLVKSWRSLALQVAKSSGGFLGFGSISAQEKQLMGLSMINS